LNGISVSHTADLATKTTQLSVLQSIQGGHATQIADNYNSLFTLNGTSLNHTNLLAGLRTDVDAVGSVSDSDIAALQSDVSTINTTLTAHDGRIFTNTTDVFQLQTNGHEGRLDSAEATVLTLVTDVAANTTLVNNLLSGLQIFGRSLTAVESDITTLRTDVDANTLSNTQFLEALQFQSTSIFAIDTAIQGLNVQVGNLETTYNAHISGAFLTIRRNVDDNNLILGTLSTQTTSLFTAMTQIYSRVQVLEDNAPPPPPPPTPFGSSIVDFSSLNQPTLDSIGSGWTEIKYLPGTATLWFPGDETWNYTGTEFLFTRGDFSVWLMCDKFQAVGENYTNTPRTITRSSISATPYTAIWFNRGTLALDPVISLRDSDISQGDGTVMYIENSHNAAISSIHPTGMYVFIR
jgi:hypothetical protein